MQKFKGFTLLELIIVMAMLGVMLTASLAILNPLAQFKKAKDARVKSDLAQIQRALESFYEDYNSYPSSSNTYLMTYTNKSSVSVTVQWGGSWQPYMNIVPKDPVVSHKYVYYSPNGQSYYLYANLERGTADPQACKSLNGNGECANVPGANLCGAKCNYGAASPNATP